MKTKWISLLFVIFLMTGQVFGEIIQSTSILFEPYPRSTVLSGGANKLTLSIQSRIPTVCRYSIGNNLPYEEMRSFDSMSATTVHTTEITGLNSDPDVINYIYVKCADKPEEYLCLGYSSLPKENSKKSRISVFTPASINEFNEEQIKKIGLWLVNEEFDFSEISQIRKINPDVLVFLNSFMCSALDGLPDEYYLRDIDGNRIEVLSGQYRLNISDFGVCDFILNNAYNKFINSDLSYDGFFIRDLNMKIDRIIKDKDDNSHQIDLNKDGIADNEEDFEKAWRLGIIYLLRNLKWYIPYAPIVAHTTASPEDTELFKILNGKSIVYFDSDLRTEDNFLGNLLDEYDKWMNRIQTRKVVLIESISEHNTSAIETISDGYKEFISCNYPSFRIGYALTLMNEGFFTQRIEKDIDNLPTFWYDEYYFELGKPSSKAKFYYLEKDEDVTVAFKTSVLDTLAKASSKVLRRDFENGVVLANGEKFPVKIILEKPFKRLNGEQSPMEQIIIDNNNSQKFKIIGLSEENEEYIEKADDFVFGSGFEIIKQGSSANWNFTAPKDGKYFINIWSPRVYKLEARKLEKDFIYYDLLQNDEIINTKKIEIYSDSNNVLIELFKGIELRSGDKLSVRAYSEENFIADAVIVNSEERFNNGEIVNELILNPMDGIILENINE